MGNSVIIEQFEKGLILQTKDDMVKSETLRMADELSCQNNTRIAENQFVRSFFGACESELNITRKQLARLSKEEILNLNELLSYKAERLAKSILLIGCLTLGLWLIFPSLAIIFRSHHFILGIFPAIILTFICIGKGCDSYLLEYHYAKQYIDFPHEKLQEELNYYCYRPHLYNTTPLPLNKADISNHQTCFQSDIVSQEEVKRKEGSELLGEPGATGKEFNLR